MKRKYYLRGLGFGILITAIVFCVAGPSKMTDAEIEERAMELGYVKAEEEVSPTISLKDLMTGTPTPSPEPTIEITPEPTEKPEVTITPAITEEPQPVETETPVPTPSSEPTVEVTPEPTKEPESTVVTAEILVELGDTAVVVCDRIEEAGILKDGYILANYLVINNLEKYINVGVHTLSSDMTLEEMANILTER